MFEILFEKAALKFLSKLDTRNKQRILEAIEKLSEDPIPHDAKKNLWNQRKAF